MKKDRQTKAPKKQWTDYVLNAGVVIVAFVVCFAIVEVSLRVFYPQGDIFYKPEPVFGWGYPPNKSGTYINDARDYRTKITINSAGFRDDEFSRTKHENDYTVVILGDSQTAAFEVPLERRFDSLISSALNNKTNTNYVFYNFGVQGYATDQEYFILEKKALQYNPDLVLLLFGPNDFTDNDVHLSGYKKWYLDEQMNVIDNGNATGFRGIIGVIQNFVRDHFQSYKFLGIRINRLRQLFSDANHQVISYPVYDAIPSSDVLRAENHTYAILGHINRILAEKNISFVVMMFDNTKGEVELNATNYARFVSLQLEKKEINFTRSLDNLAIYLRQNNIRYIDLRDSFDEHYALQNSSLIFNTDSHWNTVGHAIAARAIIDGLVENGILIKEE